MEIRLINARAVRDILNMENCITLMKEAMILVAEEKASQPIRAVLHHPEGRGVISWMPGYTAEPEWLGIKVVTVFPGNFGTEFGSHQGMVLLFEPGNGAPAAVLDGREVTAIRTAAATAVATDSLARRDARSLAIFGYGEQARTHIAALLHARPFETVQVWGRDLNKAREFCREESDRHGREITAVASPEKAATADVITTTTAASEPVMFSKWLKPGHHLNVVGSSVPTTSEIDIETVVASKYFVDFRESALELAGDLRRALEAEAVTEAHVLGSIGDVMTGKIAGRTSHSDITLFKSLGMIAEDLLSCDFILREAERRNIGHTLDWS